MGCCLRYKRNNSQPVRNLTACLETEIQEKVCRDGQPQDIPDEHLHLSSIYAGGEEEYGRFLNDSSTYPSVLLMTWNWPETGM
jgi:hypothetical protein